MVSPLARQADAPPAAYLHVSATGEHAAVIDLGPLHTDTQPIDGWYFMYGPPRDPDKPMGSRPKIPVRIWTVEDRDEVGDLMDDVRQYIQAGDELVTLTQDEWLFLARRPISEDEYRALLIGGEWK